MANVQFNLRVPEELKQKIDLASSVSGRSINAEATYRLEKSFLHDFHRSHASFTLAFGSLIEILSEDGRYNRKECMEVVGRVIAHMADPDFLKRSNDMFNIFTEENGFYKFEDYKDKKPTS